VVSRGARARLVGLAAVCALGGTAACGLLIGLEDHEAYPAEGGAGDDAYTSDGTADGGHDGGAASDAPADALGDAAGDALHDAGAVCEASLCGDACVDLQTDDSNCGKCGVACSAASCYRAKCGGNAVAQLTAGAEHACALLQAGDVWCWGADDQGQILGPADAATCPLGPCRPQPVAIPGLPNAVQISAAGDQTCAVDDDGGVWCWGSNAAGGLGHKATGDPTCTTPDASVPCNPQPTAVAGLPGPATSVASGGAGFACALVSTGVYCWGDDTYAELGPAGTIGVPSPTPQFATGGASTVAAGFAHVCAVGAGSLSCWGSNTEGELGHPAGVGDQTCAGAIPCDSSPHVLNLTGVTRLHPGSHASCFETIGGVYCVGANDVGQLGLGSDVPTSSPTLALETVTPTPLSLDFGSTTVCAITSSAGLFCWGDDETHQTAASTSTSCTAGVACVPGGSSVALTNVAEVIASTYATFARTSDGRVWAWGNNGAGQLGHLPGDAGDEGGCDPSAFPSGTECNAVPAQVQGLP
jgi:alpha-tubulin suppressor-like RCC1 family protein